MEFESLPANRNDLDDSSPKSCIEQKESDSKPEKDIETIELNSLKLQETDQREHIEECSGKFLVQKLENSKAEPGEIEHRYRKHLDRLLLLESTDDKKWEVVHQSNEIKILKTSIPDSHTILIKMYVHLLGISPDRVFKMISELEIRKQWDNILSDLEVFGKINENVDHMYSLYKAPIGLTNRDFCQGRIKAVGYRDVPFMIHFKSVEHPDCPPKCGVVRAHTFISGYIIRGCQEPDGGTRMTILTQTDIKGKVPTFIVNLAAAKAPVNWCSNFKEHAEKLIKQGRI